MVLMNALLPPVPVGTPTADAAAPDPGELRRAELRGRLAALEKPITAKERLFVEVYATNGGNATWAYRDAYDVEGPRSAHHAVDACRILQKPGVQRYLQEIRSVAASAAAIDVQALLEKDREIVRAAEYAKSITSYRVECCRHCHGVGGAYQWIDEDEYSEAMCNVMDANAAREPTKQLAMPTDEGGYGFEHNIGPNPKCRRCKGDGVQTPVIADTNDHGLAAPLYKAIRITKNGVEVLLHDVDKAKERLLRAAGAFGDDAASVGRAAAAGAAVGHAAAQAVANRAKDMSADELRKAYLQLVG